MPIVNILAFPRAIPLSYCSLPKHRCAFQNGDTLFPKRRTFEQSTDCDPAGRQMGRNDR
jgi:hypothetical protein